MMQPTEIPIPPPSSYSGNLQQRHRSEVPPSSITTSSSTDPITSTKSSTQTATPSSDMSAEMFMKEQVRQIRNELNILVVVPFLLLLTYGGRASIFVLAFGSIACYILDILESIEVFRNHLSFLFIMFYLVIAFRGH